MFTEKIGKRISPAPRAALVLCAALTMWVLVLAVSPAAARAQTSAKAQATEAANDAARGARGAAAAEFSVIVEPGDSLWSISEERLGPNASPRRVIKGAERIHALNRGRIGADPDLIFAGQELSLPPALSEGPTGASAARKSANVAEAAPRERAAKGTTGKAPGPVQRTAPDAADAEGGEAPETVAQQKAEPVGLPALPDGAAAAPVPAVRAVASNGSPTSPVASLLRKIRAEVAPVPTALAKSFADAEGRRLLGLGVWALTLLVAALMAWKLPMRRTTHEDDERWGIPSGYHGGAPPAPGTTPFFYHPGPPDGPIGNREAPRTPGLGRRAVFVGGGTAPSPGVAREAGAPAVRGRPPRARARIVPRNGLALGAHNPEVRRAPRRARARMRARRLRPRLRHGRGVSARGGR